MKKLNVIDLSCGCGGLSLGFEQAGYNILLGIDIWEDALKTFENNYENIFMHEIDYVNSCDYSSGCRIEHYGTVKDVEINYNDLTVNWKGKVDERCKYFLNDPVYGLSKFSDVGDRCNYGIIYEVEWTTETE